MFFLVSGILLAGALILFIYNGYIRSLFPGLPASNQSGMDGSGQRIQVSVLNACGTPGIAMKITEHLRSLGYDVVEIGNYGTSALEKSIVIDWVNDGTTAKKIADAVNIPQNRIVRRKSNRAMVDVSVVLGKDYRQLIPLRQGGITGSTTPSDRGFYSFIII